MNSPLDPACRITYWESVYHLLFKNISHLRWYFSLSVYLTLYLSLYLYFHLNFDNWHHRLSENIWFEGYLRSDGSVTAYLWTQEILLQTGGRDGTDGQVTGSTRGPRGPKKQTKDCGRFSQQYFNLYGSVTLKKISAILSP